MRTLGICNWKRTHRDFFFIKKKNGIKNSNDKK